MISLLLHTSSSPPFFLDEEPVLVTSRMVRCSRKNHYSISMIYEAGHLISLGLNKLLIGTYLHETS